ncbi:MAG: hypothetical protein KGO51_08325 [Alphaproteobacteria bacterium]|nr:hypothetical protein [Alphaproteobacteria bacterium]
MKVFAGLALALLTLTACSGGHKAASNDPYAGLGDAIKGWKNDLAATQISCKRAPAGEKCDTFEVACKAQRTITPDDQAKGVTAKLVADMTWSGFDDKGAPQPSTAAALFTKANGAWSRSPTKPVNPDTCADLG